MIAFRSYGDVAVPARLRKAALWAAIAVGLYSVPMGTSFMEGPVGTVWHGWAGPYAVAMASGIGAVAFLVLIASGKSALASRWVALCVAAIRAPLAVLSLIAWMSRPTGAKSSVTLLAAVTWLLFLVSWFVGQLRPIRWSAAIALAGLGSRTVVVASFLTRVLLVSLNAGLTVAAISVFLQWALFLFAAVAGMIFLWTIARGPVSASSKQSGPVPRPLAGRASSAA